MPVYRWLNTTIRNLLLLSIVGAAGCKTAPTGNQPGQGPDPSGRAQAIAAHRLAQDTADRPVPDLSAPVPSRPLILSATTQPTPEQVESEIPDPLEELPQTVARLDKLLAATATRTDKTMVEYRAGLQRFRDSLAGATRPNPVRLSLSEAVHRALRNNYQIQTQAYNPAIDATRIVEAEAQFDAVFFSDFNYNRVDRPTGQTGLSTQSDTRVFDGGIRKLLSTGMRVQASYAMTRTQTNLGLEAFNPSYFNQFQVQFSQPLLRGFGLDFNRSQIELEKLNRQISLERFEQQIRESLFNVEQAYWRLVQARRSISIQALLLEDLYSILNALYLRAEYDVYRVQLNQTQSRIELQVAQLIQSVNDLQRTEVALKALLNDPALNLSSDVPIIPSDLPTFEPIVLDQLGEVTAALVHRSELREARLAIQQAQIAIGVAKNQAMPRLDLLFTYIIDGLGSNPDRAFSQLSENDFNEYVVGLQFEWPIGNRGPEAALRRARLQQAQAIAASRAQIEQVISQVKQTIFNLNSNFQQIGPNYRAARASFDQLRAIREKAETRSPSQLQVELTADQDLATARQQLLAALVDYNISIIDLERQKGTLLRYNNVIIRGADDESCQKPYTPTMPEKLSTVGRGL